MRLKATPPAPPGHRPPLSNECAIKKSENTSVSVRGVSGWFRRFRGWFGRFYWRFRTVPRSATDNSCPGVQCNLGPSYPISSHPVPSHPIHPPSHLISSHLMPHPISPHRIAPTPHLISFLAVCGHGNCPSISDLSYRGYYSSSWRVASICKFNSPASQIAWQCGCLLRTP